VPLHKEAGQKENNKGKYRTLHCHLSKHTLLTLYTENGFLKTIILRLAKLVFWFDTSGDFQTVEFDSNDHLWHSKLISFIVVVRMYQ